MFTTIVDAGSSVQFAFDAVWDNQRVNSGANWTIGSVTTTGLSTTTVPEPSTVILLASGLGVLTIAARSRKRAGQTLS